jgi:hypothetical protein
LEAVDYLCFWSPSRFSALHKQDNQFKQQCKKGN